MPHGDADTVEFSVAAYWFGHSKVRPSYRANFGTSATDPTQQFFGLIFNPALSGSDPADLRGGCRAPRRFIDWQTFLDFGGGRVRRNKRIDTKLSLQRAAKPRESSAGPSHPPGLTLSSTSAIRRTTKSGR